MWSKVGAVALVAVGAGLWRQRPAVAGSRNAATRAVVDSAKLFKGAAPNKWRNGRLTGVAAEPLLQASAALIPAFDSYGPLLSRAARADLLGNVRKLRKAGAGPKVSDVGSLAESDPDFEDVDGPTMALFWLNRILNQIAATFEELLAHEDASVTTCATAAYLKVTAPYNLAHQRAIGRILLKIIPDRASLVRCYGQPDFDALAPVFVEWLKASAPAREAIDAYYVARPKVTPPVRWRGKRIS
mmetsp:Transcript_1666/g.5012  ORF Transcript_1666/g.5012 Transcript_1666/m.5012 type:complete len:243 (+) Transcript_1666:261-989(+)